MRTFKPTGYHPGSAPSFLNHSPALVPEVFCCSHCGRQPGMCRSPSRERLRNHSSPSSPNLGSVPPPPPPTQSILPSQLLDLQSFSVREGGGLRAPPIQQLCASDVSLQGLEPRPKAVEDADRLTSDLPSSILEPWFLRRR